jgi:CrcB protein
LCNGIVSNGNIARTLPEIHETLYYGLVQVVPRLFVPACARYPGGGGAGMIETLLVALGGAVGSVGRYWTGVLAARAWGEAFPWGTLIINVLGSFIIGGFATLTLPDGALPASADMRVLVMVGFCGGYTTFSSFSLQTLALMRAGDWTGAVGNVLLSVVLCLLAVVAGHLLATRLGVPGR